MTAEHNFNPWPEVDYLRTEEAEAGPSRMQPFEFQPLADGGIDIDLSALYCSPSALMYYAGEPSGENSGETLQTHIEFKMTRPVALNEKPIEHRRENQVTLEISVTMLSDQASIPWDSINVSEKHSVRHSMIHGKRARLDLTLEVCGATTGTVFRVACDKCATRTSSVFPNQSLFAFTAKDGLIEIKGGKARVIFRFLCRPEHHGTTDTEYQLSARLSHRGQTVGQHIFPNWFRLVSHLKRRKNTLPATVPLSIGAPELMEFSDNLAESQALSNACASGSGSSRTYAGGHEVTILAQPLTTSSQSLPEAPASTPRPDEGSAPPVHVPEHVNEELPVLRRVNPRRGPTSGGDEVDLIVSNLPPTIQLYARFGSKLVSTAHIAPGVLFCNLPAAAHPGVVDVTLRLTPTIDGEPYGNSLASFEYEADSTRAVSLLMKLLNGKLLMEAMPLIQRLLQQNAAWHGAGGQGGPDDSNMVLPSSLSESAFVDILSALEPLPDFDYRLAMVNEQGQTLLHLAVHLRYRILVQKLISWGIDLSVKDVNGSTALDAAYLCDDRFAIALLAQGGAEPFVLVELGQTPTKLTTPTTSTDGDTDIDIEEMTPQTLDDVVRVGEQLLPPDIPIPTHIQRPVIDPVDKAGNLVEERERSDIVQSAAETQETSPKSTAEEDHPPEYMQLPAGKDVKWLLLRRFLYGDGFDEPHEKQQDIVNEQKSRPVVDDPAQEEEEWPMKYPIAPQHCRRWGKPETTIIKHGTIPAGPIHFTNPVPTLPEGWEEHTHLEGKLFYVRYAPDAIQGASTTLTIVTDSDPRNSRNLRGLESTHRQVVEDINNRDVRLPAKVQLFIELYPDQDECWGHVGGYYLADLDNQSVFWVDSVDSLDLGLGDKINFGVFGEQHLKLTLHRQFWYHIECYPLPGSINEAKEHEILLKHLTFAMLDVSTSPTSTSTYTASECSAFIGSIEKTPVGSRTWPIARIAGFMAEHRFYNYYGHPSARLNYLHAFEVEQTEDDAPASDASAEQTPDQPARQWRIRDLLPRFTTFWYSLVAFWLRLCSIFLFDTPIRHHTALEDVYVNKIVYRRHYKRIMKTLLDDWSDASLLATVLWTANMAYLAIPMPTTTTYTSEELSLLQTASNTCSLFSTIFSIGALALGLINTRKHRGDSSYKDIDDFLQGAHHHHYGFRPLAIVYALPIALLMWAVLSFAGSIAIYCLIATTVIPRVAVLALGALLIACTFVTVWYFWQRETRWGYDVEGVSPKGQQRMPIADWFWDWCHSSAKR